MASPDLELNGIDRAHLNVLVTMEGFKVLQNIMESEVEKFKVALLNANPSKHDEVIAAHQLAKAAAMFYAGVVKRLNSELELYRNSPKASDKPIDATEGLIDLGEVTKEFPNFFDGGEE